MFHSCPGAEEEGNSSVGYMHEGCVADDLFGGRPVVGFMGVHLQDVGDVVVVREADTFGGAGGTT